VGAKFFYEVATLNLNGFFLCSKFAAIRLPPKKIFSCLSARIHFWVLTKDDTTDWLLWSQNISGEKSSHRSVSRLRASL